MPINGSSPPESSSSIPKEAPSPSPTPKEPPSSSKKAAVKPSSLGGGGHRRKNQNQQRSRNGELKSGKSIPSVRANSVDPSLPSSSSSFSTSIPLRTTDSTESSSAGEPDAQGGATTSSPSPSFRARNGDSDDLMDALFDLREQILRHIPACAKRVPVAAQALQKRFSSGWQRIRPVIALAASLSSCVLATLAILWLDCLLRGVGSTFRLGSAVLFLLICFTTLNLMALSGFLIFLVTLVVSTASAFFFGYAVALLIFGIFGGVVLWLYGSFWITASVILVGGILFILDRWKLAILLTTIYAAISAKGSVGWLMIFFTMNLAFLLSDVATYFLQSHATSDDGMRSQSSRESNFQTGAASTSGEHSGEALPAEEEVLRLFNCRDHYAALGFNRFKEIDQSILKREYRKKVLLAHPDKNLGNDVAEEAFKKLQNAYEVLRDPSKKKVYDDELKREELLKTLRHFTQLNGRYGTEDVSSPHHDFEGVKELSAECRQVACKKCGGMHIWICTERSKMRARWCQECQEYHQAKDGEGWVEQSGHSILLGLFQRVEPPHAFACAESKIYDVTEWIKCQGMKCATNTHKPTFHVSTAALFKSPRGNKPNKGSGKPTNEFNFGNLDENVTEQEFFEWLQNAMASGVFNEDNTASPNPPEPDPDETKGANKSKPSRKKRKGKKQW